MRRSRVALLLIALVAAAGLVAGCVESSEEDAQTPSGASTVMNSALQTDSEGNTVTAPAATAPAGGGETTGGGGGDASGGDVEAGLEVFAANCTSCHTDNGNQAGVGPQLAGAGLDAATIETTVVNGRGIMPAGLVSGEDLTNVVAYVASIQ